MLGRTLAFGLAVLLFVALSHGAQPSREVPAEEILKIIESGKPVEYNNITINGDLNVGWLNLTTRHLKRIGWEKSFLHLRDDSKIIAPAII